jgi:transketolase
MGRSKIPTVTDENGRPYFGEGYEYRYGRMEVIRKGENVALVAAGNMLHVALQAWAKLEKKDIRVTLVSVSDWSDLHEDDLKMLASHAHVVTLEDHNVKTGLGTALAAALMTAGLSVGFTKLGISNYAASGKPDELYRMLGIDAETVATRVGTVVGEQLKIGC